MEITKKALQWLLKIKDYPSSIDLCDFCKYEIKAPIQIDNNDYKHCIKLKKSKLDKYCKIKNMTVIECPYFELKLKNNKIFNKLKNL